MLVSLSWLKEWIQLDLSDEEIGNTLTLAGLEVDKIEKTPLSFTGIVVGEIIDTKKHPDADQLKVATVSDGIDNFQVVCGASNCKIGMKTAFAKINATLTDKSGKMHKIKKGKLRGVESFGMLCSEAELGLSEENEGIMNLDFSLQNGTLLTTIYEDTIFEISLTPNLGHCTSVQGIARELSSLLNLPITPPEIWEHEDKSSAISSHLCVQLEQKENCKRYLCSIIKDVKVQDSPQWLKKKLASVNIRSINNIVDVTNYVMLEMGQPLHAFDFDAIEGGKIIVRDAKDNETITTLDGKKRELSDGILVIADAKKPIAVAGVMGGENSEVKESTTTVVLESAYFDPSAVRKSSKKLHLRSDSSSRFEKNIDPLGCKKAILRATDLIVKLANGTHVSGIIDENYLPTDKKRIVCRSSRIKQILGLNLSSSEIETLLKRLEMEFIEKNADSFTLCPPSYRNDITTEIDIVEEVARLYGYNNIPISHPKVSNSTIAHSPIYLLENKVRTQLIGSNLQEFITCDLISPKLASLIESDSVFAANPIKVLKPSSVDQSILRTSLLPGMLQCVKHNQDHKNTNIHAFELGRIHFKNGSEYSEREVVSIILTGSKDLPNWKTKARCVDFFDLKGLLENFLSAMQIPTPTFSPSTLSSLHPQKQAAIQAGNINIGSFGEVHPQIIEQLGVNESVYFAEIDLIDLMQSQKKHLHMKALSEYPGSQRDWTQTFSKAISYGSILEQIEKIPSKILKKVSLLDIYQSEKLGKDKQNITLRFYYEHDKKTLDYNDVEKEHARIIEKLNF